MTEHEKLVQILIKIWYDNKNLDYCFADNWVRTINVYWGNRVIDVREVIFTQEFIDLLFKYIAFELKEDFKEHLYNFAFLKINNPVEYLYNLINNNEKHINS